MAKGYRGPSSSGSSAGGRRYGRSGSSSRGTRGVSAARLNQKSGASNSFGGYTKVNHGDGSFSMRRTVKQTRATAGLTQERRIRGRVAVDDLVGASEGLDGLVCSPEVVADLALNAEGEHQRSLED
jgi:hypothetical protein